MSLEVLSQMLMAKEFARIFAGDRQPPAVVLLLPKFMLCRKSKKLLVSVRDCFVSVSGLVFFSVG